MTARTYRLTEQGQITDRYTKAIEQLGDDKLDIRLGGIYALERIAGDSKRDHPTVVEVLSAFVRERTDPTRTEKPTVADVLNAFLILVNDQTRNPTPSDASTKIKPPADVQTTVTVLGRLPSRPGVSRGDLTGARLAGARLGGADLTAVKDLTQQQVDVARGDDDTKLPDGLQRPAHWIADPDMPSAGDP